MAELHLAAREHQRLAAHLADADVEAYPRPRRGLLEDERDDPPGERLLGVGHALRRIAAGDLHRHRLVEDRAELARGRDVQVEEVPHATASTAAAAFSIRAIPSSTSASVRLSGGSRRTTLSAAGTTMTRAS